MSQTPPPLPTRIPAYKTAKFRYALVVFVGFVALIGLRMFKDYLNRPPIEFLDLVAYETPGSKSVDCGIRGNIRNKSNKTVSYMVLKFRCYDASGRLLDRYWPRWSEYSMTEDFPPNSTTPFDISPINSAPIPDVKSVKAVILEVIYKDEFGR